jgi:hypothetical protein
LIEIPNELSGINKINPTCTSASEEDDEEVVFVGADFNNMKSIFDYKGGYAF